MKVGDSIKINGGPFDNQNGQVGIVEDTKMQKCSWLEENPDYEERAFFVRGDWYFLDELTPVSKPEQRASADPGLRDLDLSELGISKKQAATFDRLIVEQDTIAREDDAWLEAERRS